jgi:hypothetical protein
MTRTDLSCLSKIAHMQRLKITKLSVSYVFRALPALGSSIRIQPG